MGTSSSGLRPCLFPLPLQLLGSRIGSANKHHAVENRLCEALPEFALRTAKHLSTSFPSSHPLPEWQKTPLSSTLHLIYEKSAIAYISPLASQNRTRPSPPHSFPPSSRAFPWQGRVRVSPSPAAATAPTAYPGPHRHWRPPPRPPRPRPVLLELEHGALQGARRPTGQA